MASYKAKIARLNALLDAQAQVVQVYATEVQQLERWKLEQLQTWDKVDTFARKYTRLGASVAAVALELMKRGVQLPIPAPAVPYGVDEEAANRIALAVYDCKNGINQEPLLYTINRILATEAHPLSAEGQRSLLQSAEVPS